jgi:hypothetical protein
MGKAPLVVEILDVAGEKQLQSTHLLMDQNEVGQFQAGIFHFAYQLHFALPFYYHNKKYPVDRKALNQSEKLHLITLWP